MRSGKADNSHWTTCFVGVLFVLQSVAFWVLATKSAVDPTPTEAALVDLSARPPNFARDLEDLHRDLQLLSNIIAGKHTSQGQITVAESKLKDTAAKIQGPMEAMLTAVLTAEETLKDIIEDGMDYQEKILEGLKDPKSMAAIRDTNDEFPPSNPQVHPLRLGILSFAPSGGSDDLKANRECHSKIHLNDNLFFEKSVVSGLTMALGRFKDGKPEFSRRQMGDEWSQVWLLRRLLPSYDYIFWAPEGFLLDPMVAVEDLIVDARVKGRDAQIWIIPGGDKSDPISAKSPLLIKNSYLGHFLLDTWWKFGTDAEERLCTSRFLTAEGEKSKLDLNSPLPWLWHALIVTLERHSGIKAKCIRDPECGSTKLATCFSQYLKKVESALVNGPVVLDSEKNVKWPAHSPDAPCPV